MMIARRCCCSAISVLFQTTRPRSVLVSQHKYKNSLRSIDRSHFFVFFFFERFFFISREDVSHKPSFKRKTLSIVVVCSRKKKKNRKKVKVNSSKRKTKNLSTWSPLLSTGSHASKISGNWCVFCGVKFSSSLFLCIKLKLFSRSTL